MSHAIENGAFDPAPTDRPRRAITDRLEFRVEPHGETSMKARNGFKMPMGGEGVSEKVVLFEGRMGSIRTYVTERAGKIHVIMTKNEILP